jgi:hypothetical protein
MKIERSLHLRPGDIKSHIESGDDEIFAKYEESANARKSA